MNGKLALRRVLHGLLFKMLFKVKVPTDCNAAQARAINKIKFWHERMDHVNVRAVKHACEQLRIDRVVGKDFFCEGCVLGKQSRKSHPSVGLESNYGPGGKIYTDVCGSVNISTASGTRFFLVLKNENTGFRKVYFMAHKSEVINRFKEFEAFVRTQIGTQIKVLRSDNGMEYTCGKFETLLNKQGIIHELSSPYISEQNGRAEREIRTLVESARSMLHAKKVDKKLWSEAVNTACYILNRTIKPGDMTTPFEKWFKRKPTIKHLKIFGAQAYLNVPGKAVQVRPEEQASNPRRL
ncbi:hypothetical protein TSAR_005738 [Trichomalopsis sarcophagae]|uniref:Integrase catalytic domain-containing protein n=1 Tax=Trichomalopsis sarcophagae TaxID=543379 RepID=A0A232FFY4_9HYME|nr:hypothetical protein TSAR_005738 [Trichomalopsis sarcophagae]